MATSLPGGTVHKLPDDMRKALINSKKALLAWESISPLARNEWICWTTSVKKQETRDEHRERMLEELASGKRRPCCWIGCIHRTDKKISPSVQAVLEGRLGKTKEAR